ncbi:MAG: rhodanese-like domain-containing protein [Gammaproteobacteria bacterium]|nr:rhodanese-like domain-containing protein [Gammaproteobacteria bacterium]
MEQLIEFTANHPILVGAAIALTIAVLVFELRQLGDGTTGLLPNDAVQLINAGAPIFDLRAGDAFSSGHIVGAKHWPTENIEEQLPKLQKKYKDKPFLMCDDRGEIASRIIQRLRRNGLSQSFHLRGGMQAWLQDNLPVAKQNNTVAKSG